MVLRRKAKERPRAAQNGKGKEANSRKMQRNCDAVNCLEKKMPRSMLQHRAERVGQISPQDIVSVLIVAREKGKGNEKKAGIQDHLGHAP
jgi:hypothetical protein